MAIAYGIDVLPKNDPYIEAAEKGLATVAIAAVPGAYLVDTLPFLKHVPDWMPGAGFKLQAKQWRTFADRVLEAPFAAVKKAMVSSVRKPVAHGTLTIRLG